MSKFTWNEENTATLEASVAGIAEVSQDQLVTIAGDLGTTPRSVGAKLRKMDYTVAKATAKASAWSADQEAELTTLVTSNSGELTYAEIAASFQGGAFSAKQVQGKLLSMELFGQVRKAERKAAPRTYTPVEEARFIELVNGGATMEVLAGEFDKTLPSVRGKALSLLRSEHISAMPAQEKSNATAAVDVFDGIEVSGMSVEDIAESTGKTVRGIKSTLSRRGLSCSNYDGAAKREKLDAKAE